MPPLPSTSAEYTVNSSTWRSASWFTHLTCHHPNLKCHAAHTLNTHSPHRPSEKLPGVLKCSVQFCENPFYFSAHQYPCMDFMWITSQITLSPKNSVKKSSLSTQASRRSLRPQPGADGSDWTDRRSKYPFLSVCLMIWLTSPEPLRFTHFFAVKKGKWEIWNKLLFFFTLLTGNPLRTRREFQISAFGASCPWACECMKCCFRRTALMLLCH